MTDAHTHSVVIVEDSQDTRDSLAMLLELHGHHAVTVPNGRDALEMIRAGRVNPCVVVLDLVMPHMDGMAVLRDIRSSHPHIPVIVFTGHDGFRKQALATGCTAALLKPSEPSELLRLVGDHCPPRA
jgi:DNA-binding NtrC family response regulator